MTELEEADSRVKQNMELLTTGAGEPSVAELVCQALWVLVGVGIIYMHS